MSILCARVNSRFEDLWVKMLELKILHDIRFFKKNNRKVLNISCKNVIKYNIKYKKEINHVYKNLFKEL